MIPSIKTRLPTMVLLGLLLTAPLASAQNNLIKVPATPALSLEKERQVHRIGSKIHCPICSGEAISQSQTDIARQMLNEVREMLRQGHSEQQILNKFASSYGERILLEPPKRGLNWLLWGLPIAGLLLGGAVWWHFLRRASDLPEQLLSQADEQRIEELLATRKNE